MDSNFHEIAVRLSRSRSFLIRAACVIVAIATAIAFVLSKTSFSPPAENKPLHSRSAQAEPSNETEWISFVRSGHPHHQQSPRFDLRFIQRRVSSDIAEHVAQKLQKAELSTEMMALLMTYQEGLHQGSTGSAIAELKALPPELRYRAEFLGDLSVILEDYASASTFYEAESQRFPDSLYAKRSAVVAAQLDDNPARIRSLLAAPGNSSLFEAGELMKLYTDARAFVPLTAATLRHQAEKLLGGSTIPALFTAALWFLILSPFWKENLTRWFAALFAFFAGMLSAAATLVVVMIQDRLQGLAFNPNETDFAQFLYFLVGISLREETLKLLFFLPIAIWVARRRSDVEAMMLAATVGLGFAFSENIAYFGSGLDTYIAWIRFLTANVLHFSLTGIVGFYLHKLIVRKFHGLEEFLASFILAVIAHGVYNAILAMPSLAEYSALSPILIAIIAYRFFDPLKAVMDIGSSHRRISPLGVFVIGSVLMTCIVLVASATNYPFRFALGAFVASVAGMIPLAFAFIGRFREL